MSPWRSNPLSGGITISATNGMTDPCSAWGNGRFYISFIVPELILQGFVNQTDSTYFALVSSSWNFGEPTSGLANTSGTRDGNHHLQISGNLWCQPGYAEWSGLQRYPCQADHGFQDATCWFSVPTICYKKNPLPASTWWDERGYHLNELVMEFRCPVHWQTTSKWTVTLIR